ncbi:hypothetical protein NE237_010932 [Protea cynaroides]|uniref:Uncharacterized protein n=1 Tax=Protea cynaroides TaxID=273540 RepID=A0A9Q0L0B5_9MAGN|nr:hypothetical protein NE237_010932 [Protea cynaroides]
MDFCSHWSYEFFQLKVFTFRFACTQWSMLLRGCLSHDSYAIGLHIMPCAGLRLTANCLDVHQYAPKFFWPSIPCFGHCAILLSVKNSSCNVYWFVFRLNTHMQMSFST